MPFPKNLPIRVLRIYVEIDSNRKTNEFSHSTCAVWKWVGFFVLLHISRECFEDEKRLDMYVIYGRILRISRFREDIVTYKYFICFRNVSVNRWFFYCLENGCFFFRKVALNSAIRVWNCQKQYLFVESRQFAIVDLNANFQIVASLRVVFAKIFDNVWKTKCIPSQTKDFK